MHEALLASDALSVVGASRLYTAEASAIESGVDIGMEIKTANTKSDHEAIATY